MRWGELEHAARVAQNDLIVAGLDYDAIADIEACRFEDRLRDGDMPLLVDPSRTHVKKYGVRSPVWQGPAFARGPWSRKPSFAQRNRAILLELLSVVLPGRTRPGRPQQAS